MSASTIRKALGTLQDDSDHAEAWAELEAALGFDGANKPLSPPAGSPALEPSGDPTMSRADLLSVLAAAKEAHHVRREDDAVARLLMLEAALAYGTPGEADIQAELATLLDEQVMDDVRAVMAYTRLLELRPGDAHAEEALEKSQAKRGKWAELVTKYVEEARATEDSAFKSSLLMSAAEAAYRYGRPSIRAHAKDSAKKAKKHVALTEEIIGGLKEAIEIDAANRRALAILERMYREEEKHEELAAVVEQLATYAPSKEETISAFLKLARVYAKKLGSKERAAAAYERVIDLSPGHPEATSALVDFFTARELWDHLVALYDEQLATAKAADEAGTLLQVAMVHWRMRNRPDQADPYFERLRKLDPGNLGMLSFFRMWAPEHGGTSRLGAILSEAQRVLPEGADRRAVTTDLAKLAEEGTNATKAIEQWRAVYRQDPANEGARDALKRLYRQTGGWNALTDLLRSELERAPQDDAAVRLPILRDVASIYREHVKSDSALVTVLAQIVTLDPDDISAVRELARVYETLGRWRDLLAIQTKLAEAEVEPGAKAELYRSVARRWLDQFSNVQNAIEAYEQVFSILHDDVESKDKLKELYTKRRAYKPLYELLDRESSHMVEGAPRREIWVEMAKLASERLDRGSDATALYKKVLAEDPSAMSALDALEKQAERDKDWATVAEVLERRATLADDDAARLTVLQKLGGVYAERLQDHKGAMSAWHRVLSLAPGNAKALRVLRETYLALGDYDGLTALYAASNDWEGLVEVLSAAADKATDPTAKIDLSYRATDVYTDKLRTPERAFRAYERVLQVRPDDVRAATALVPLYERDEKWTRLPALYEVLFAHAADVEEKLALLEKLTRVAGQHLQDRNAAFGYAKRAYDLAPAAEGALGAFESAARLAGAWDAFVDTLKARSDAGDVSGVSKDERRKLRSKLAEVCATELGRVDEAVKAYRELVLENDSDEELVQTLDRILRAKGLADDLRWLFDVRVGRANTSHQLEILNEWAVLEEESFNAPERAVAVHQRILQVIPTYGASLQALARLLRASGDAAGAVAALETDRNQREGAERAAREVELAELYVEPLKRYTDGLAAAERAVALVPGDKRALAVIEQLLRVGDTRARAAVVLEASYADEGAFAKQAEVLEVMIATAASKGDRVKLYGRLADVSVSLGDHGRAFDVIVRAASEFPAELELWDRLAILAAHTDRAPELVAAIAHAVPPVGTTGLPGAVERDLAERAATLYDEKLGEIDHARPYLERILASEPSNPRAFARLKQILTTREKWTDLEELYERVIAVSDTAERKTELLSEIALIAEEILNDAPRATRLYERILELDAAHGNALRALDSLYVAQSSWDKLASLLEAQLAAGAGGDPLELRLRIGKLLFEKLGAPDRALDQLEVVLRDDIANREARDLVERCLEMPALRERSATILEQVYDAKDEVRDLVRVLEVRLESAREPAAVRELLRRIANLRDERLKDDTGAFDTYARLIPLDPDDVHSRERALDIARRTNGHERVAKVLAEAAANAGAPQPKADILSQVAHIYEDFLGDGARAEAVYREVLEIDSSDATIALPAARSLERLYAGASKSKELAAILEAQVKLEENVDSRRELYGRLGELYSSLLDDPKSAIVAWKARLADDPNDETALVALDRLYERIEDHRNLVDVLRARENLSEGEVARKRLLRRIAKTLGEKLGDIPEAITAYKTIIDDFGPERETLSSLAALYELTDRWPELAETLEADLALADAPADRLALLVRIGQLRRARLDDLDGALEAYRQALAIEPSHAPTRAALEELLSNGKARRDAAGILRPLYEAEGEHARLLRVLDIEAELNESISEKLALYAQAASVAEGPLGDSVKAFEYASRGLKEAAAEAEFPAWLERAERLTAKTERYRELVDLLMAVAPDVVAEEQQLGVTLKVADLARTQLRDRDLALEYYRKALEIRPDDRQALEALAALYEELGDPAPLLEILKRRTEAAEGDDERRALLFQQASLSDEQLKDPQGAIEVYEQILEVSMDPRALEALERLYSTTSRWDDLLALYERQLGDSDLPRDQKASVHHRLGAVLEKQLKDFDRAFDQYDEALKLDPQHEVTIAALEALMAAPEHAARAAEMLEAVYLSRAEWGKVMRALEARLATSEDPDARRTLLRRLAKLHEEQEEDYKAALETIAKLLGEDITDETTWAELERLARVANAGGRLAEIYAGELAKVESDEPVTAKLARRTGELFEQEKDVERALHFYRRAYAFAPEERTGPFESIDRLLRDAGRPADRVALYREALDHANDPADRIATLHTIATLEETDLKDDDRAIDTYRSALEVDETDARAIEAVSRLYQRRSRWRDLADLTRKRAEQSALPEDESKHRLDLAHLLERKLGEVDAAIDEYQLVVDLTVGDHASATSREAVKALEQLVVSPEHKARVVEILRPLYERADDWRQLVAINGERLALAVEPADRVAVLRESAKLWEERGNDQNRAFEAVRDAFVLDPDDGDTRGELDRLTAATSRWDDLADAYERGIAKIEGVGQRELLHSLATVHDAKRDDPRRALGAYERLHRLDETEIEPLDAMDTLSTLLSDWPALVGVLVKKAELTSSDQDRADLWRRVGESRRDMLDDAPGAIEAYERALELDSESRGTLDHLITLYEGKDDSSRLVDLYRRRVELAGPEEEARKYELLILAANRYEHGLKEPREAIELLNEALAVKPGDSAAMQRLDALYTAQRLWPELLENLRLQASSAPDDAARRVLKRRIGDLLSGELEDARQALEAYREVLDGGPDEAVITAIRRIGEANEDLRAEAADALEPVLRGAGRHADLVEVCEMRLRAQTDPHDRARTLRTIAEVAERDLGDKAKAENALLRGLTEEPDDHALHADIERLAVEIGTEGWGRYADALAERAGALFEPAVTTDLYMRLGRVAEQRLGDDLRAAKAYVHASEQTGDNPEVLAALDRIYTKLGEARPLADILERRVAVETDAPQQADLYHRLAMLQINDFKKPGEGVATLRLALERKADHEPSRVALEGLLTDPDLFADVFEVLEGVYRQLHRPQDLASLYERRIAGTTVARDRSRARLDLARVLEDEVKDPVRAQRVVEEAVTGDPSDESALDELTRLASVNNAWKEACDALERSLRGAQDLPSATAAELWVKLGEWRRDRLNASAEAEESFQEALKITPEDLAVLQSLEALQRGPGREKDLVGTLRARAKLESDLGTKRELLREAKGLAEGTVGDRALAEAVLRDILLEDEADGWALEELTKLRDLAEDHAEVVKLLLRRAELASDGAQIVELKKRAADVLEQKLSGDVQAITLYEEIFEQEPGDFLATTKLRALYEKTARTRELGKLLERLIDMAETPGARSTLRLDLARLEETAFQSPAQAATTLRAVLEEEPGHTDAVLALSQLLERTGQDEELADLLNEQIELARGRNDEPGELALRIRLGEVFEGRLNDTTRALASFQQVLGKDPLHRKALEAVARLAESRFDWELVSTALTKLVELATDQSGVPDALRLAFARAHFEDSEGIQRALQRALELDPRNKEVRIQIRGIYEKEKKWTELAALLVGDVDLLAEANPAPVPDGVDAKVLAAVAGGSTPPPPPVGPLAEQVKLLRRAAELHIRERHSPGEAVPLLERASALSPFDRELLLQLVDAYTAASRERDAATVLEKIIASFGSKRSKELSVYHHRLGRALAGLGDKEAGLVQFDLAFKIDPGSVSVLKDLGVLALETNDLDRAQKTFRALLLQRLDPSMGITKGEVFLYLGEISGKQGDKAKAVQMLERALENEPTLERARTRLQELKG
jgi:tetratricopeptide (TPR) repeat protein